MITKYASFVKPFVKSLEQELRDEYLNRRAEEDGQANNYCGLEFQGDERSFYRMVFVKNGGKLPTGGKKVRKRK
jgi:hypothetical protein